MEQDTHPHYPVSRRYLGEGDAYYNVNIMNHGVHAFVYMYMCTYLTNKILYAGLGI